MAINQLALGHLVDSRRANSNVINRYDTVSKAGIQERIVELMIRVENLTKSFNGLAATDGLTCCFERNRISVILGGSGSGKSTLLKLLSGLEKPDSGKVFFEDQELTAMSRKELYAARKKMGMLFQGSALFNYLNVFENIAFPLREHTRLAEPVVKTVVKMKLELVGLRGIEGLMPSQLSGGMAKRIGLARAIAMDPKVVFYDEPTSGLDPISAGVISKLILDFNRALGVTSIVVSHDIHSSLKIADRVFILFHGKLVAEGTPQEIMQSGDPRVVQFISGEPEGPIPFSRTDKDYFEDIMIP